MGPGGLAAIWEGVKFAGKVGDKYLTTGSAAPSVRRERKKLMQDIRDMQAGKLGMTDLQRQSLLTGSRQANAQRAAEAQARIALEQGASGAPGPGAAYVEAQRAVASAANQANAQANAQVAALSAQQARDEEANIQARLAARANQARADWQGTKDPATGKGSIEEGLGVAEGAVTGVRGDASPDSMSDEEFAQAQSLLASKKKFVKG